MEKQTDHLTDDIGLGSTGTTMVPKSKFGGGNGLYPATNEKSLRIIKNTQKNLLPDCAWGHAKTARY